MHINQRHVNQSQLIRQRRPGICRPDKGGQAHAGQINAARHMQARQIGAGGLPPCPTCVFSLFLPGGICFPIIVNIHLCMLYTCPRILTSGALPQSDLPRPERRHACFLRPPILRSVRFYLCPGLSQKDRPRIRVQWSAAVLQGRRNI